MCLSYYKWEPKAILPPAQRNHKVGSASASLWSSSSHLPFGRLCTGCWHGVWRLTVLLCAKTWGGFTELKQTMKLYTVRKHTQHKLNPLSAGKTLTIHLKVNDNFGVTCIWTEMATPWAACFSQETVVLEEARYHSSGTSQDGCSNRWNVLITPDWYLWQLRFNYILQWQKTRPLLYLWITFYSNLLITDAISLCEQKLTLVFFFSFTVSFQNKNTFTGKS